MLPAPKNYAIYPSVVPADKPVEMTVVPNERAFLLTDGKEYTLTVASLNGDEPNYHTGTAQQQITAVAHGGILRFTHTFPAEQMHILTLTIAEKKTAELAVYSLYEDLYALRPLKGDLHSHSYRSDGRRDPAAAMGHYREQGYEFYALTDHNRYYPGEEIDEVYAGVALGIHRVTGEELHTPGSVLHIVHIGGTESVTAQYIKDPDGYEKEVDGYRDRVPVHVPAQYADRYARAMWATDKIHAAGGLAILAHPSWRPGRSKMYNVNDELSFLFLKSGMFDAFELVGGGGQVANSRHLAMWQEAALQGFRLPIVGSSDVHHLAESTCFPYRFTLCFAADNTDASIKSAIRQGLSVAVDAVGDDCDRQYRCYGSLRLITYAHFLLTHYYGRLQRICQGEGVAMRQYAMGVCGKELIEIQVKASEDFRLRFFGKRPPVLPDGRMLAFEEKWRARQLEGPTGKGSLVHIDPPNRQI